MKTVLMLLAATLASVPLSAQSHLIIGNGALVKTKGSVHLVLYNTNLRNEGVLDQPVGGGTVKFTGNADVTLNNGNVITLNRLLLAKSVGANLVLQGKLGVRTEVNFTSGSLHLQYARSGLDLLGTGILRNETETNRAYSSEGGFIQTFADLYAPASANPGNLGVSITSAADLGLTTVLRTHAAHANVSGANSSILRQYTILPENNSGLDATLRFQYLDAELDGLEESNLTLWSSSNRLNWSKIGYDTKDAQANYATKTGLADFASFTLSVDDGIPANITSSRQPSPSIEEASRLTATASPNPAIRYFNIAPKSSKTGNLQVAVLDAAGRLVETKIVAANQVLQLGHLYTPGVYYAVLVQGKQKVILKLVKVSE